MKPGRKSSYDLLAPMIPGQSPPPPEELEPDQQLEWEAITARLPADWFTGENIPMLKELCRHITYARELAKEIAEVKAMLSEVVAGTAAEVGEVKRDGCREKRVVWPPARARLPVRTHRQSFDQAAADEVVAIWRCKDCRSSCA